MSQGFSFESYENGYFLDLFSGCGGFSLGMAKAGWKGVLAVEKDPMAFETFSKNLIDSNMFGWPDWLPKKPMGIDAFIKCYKKQLITLRNSVDVVVGGPPCQGFSLAGRRNPDDPRNKLFERYLEVIQILQPRYLLMENVEGFDTPFIDPDTGEKVLFSKALSEKLKDIGYVSFQQRVRSCDWGVPQLRPRFIMLAIRRDEGCLNKLSPDVLNELLEAHRKKFLISKGLSEGIVSAGEAISDLEISRNGLIEYMGSYGGKGFAQINYTQPQEMSNYLSLLREGCNGMAPNSLRLARHKPSTIEKFKLIQKICTRGRSVPAHQRKQLGIRKQAIYLLSSNKPSGTVTTLPDDIIHYSEPRTPTVREMARLQSFPDWFSFYGKYTTGGRDRVKECPRFTQVGNAVPPLMAEGIASFVAELAK